MEAAWQARHPGRRSCYRRILEHAGTMATKKRQAMEKKVIDAARRKQEVQ
jgi:hypothetical protein